MKRGSALVASLAVIAIILVLVVIFLKPSVGGLAQAKAPRKDGKGITTLGAARASAQDEVCKSNLSQVRQSIQVAESSDEIHPASLDDLHLGSEITHCPIGGETYSYDFSTGKVMCPHPGHENF